jgi:hypothetical protein
MTSLLRRLVLVLAVLLVAVPVAAEEPVAEEPVAPVFLRSEAWFHGTSTPVTNIDAGNGEVPTWDGTKPTGPAGSAYAGNQLSFATSGVDHQPGDHFTVSGPVTGELDTMAVTLYALLPGQPALPCGMDLAFDLRIDDEEILYQPQLGASTGMTVEQVSGPLYKVKFVFTRLHEAMTTYGIPTGPEVEHTVFLNAMNFYVCQEAVWLFDGAEVPSGAIFNAAPEELSGYTTIDVFDPPPPSSGG